MEEVSGEKLEALLKEAEEKGMQVEFLPSKLVCTKKPGKKGGRNKIRWVICGNFEQVKEGENTFSSGTTTFGGHGLKTSVCGRDR